MQLLGGQGDMVDDLWWCGGRGRFSAKVLSMSLLPPSASPAPQTRPPAPLRHPRVTRFTPFHPLTSSSSCLAVTPSPDEGVSIDATRVRGRAAADADTAATTLLSGDRDRPAPSLGAEGGRARGGGVGARPRRVPAPEGAAGGRPNMRRGLALVESEPLTPRTQFARSRGSVCGEFGRCATEKRQTLRAGEHPSHPASTSTTTRLHSVCACTPLTGVTRLDPTRLDEAADPRVAPDMADA